MILKITPAPFAKEIIQPTTKGSATNISGGFAEYEITQNGLYLISGLAGVDFITNIYRKTATTISVFSVPSIIDYNPFNDLPAEIDETNFNIIQERLFSITVQNEFDTKSQTLWNKCASFIFPKEALRQFILVEVSNIDGTVGVITNQRQGTEPKNFMQ